MWLIARGRAKRARHNATQLKAVPVENDLASAVDDARRTEYERARFAASSFSASLLEQG